MEKIKLPWRKRSGTQSELRWTGQHSQWPPRDWIGGRWGLDLAFVDIGNSWVCKVKDIGNSLKDIGGYLRCQARRGLTQNKPGRCRGTANKLLATARC